MQLQRLRFCHTPLARSASILGFLDHTLRSDAGFSLLDEYPSLFGDYPGGESLFLEEDGRIASHVAILSREVLHQSLRLKIGMVGSVVTAPEFRGQRLASRLVHEALRELKRQGAALAVLWSDAHEFYAPLGFQRVGRERDFRFSPEALPSTRDVSVVDYDPSRHAAATWELYLRHDVKLDRSLEEHKRLFAIPRAKIFVTEREGLVTSYCAVNKGVDFEGYVHEWAGDPAEVARNVAWIQRHRFPTIPLTLIAPAHVPLDALSRMALKSWEGVLGWVKLLDRSRLLLTYGELLKARGIAYRWHRETQKFRVGDVEHDITTDAQCLALVLGEGGKPAPAQPLLPLFLWGFDSI